MSSTTTVNPNHTNESPLNEMKQVLRETVEDVRYDIQEGAERLADQAGRVKAQVSHSIQEKREQVEDQITGKHYTLGALALSFVLGLTLGKVFR